MEANRNVDSKIIDKEGLIKAVSEKTSLSPDAITAITNTLLETISDSIINGYDVKLDGIDTFTTTVRSAREGRNPKTGEKIVIPNSYIASFRIEDEFRDKLQLYRSKNSWNEIDCHLNCEAAIANIADNG